MSSKANAIALDGERPEVERAAAIIDADKEDLKWTADIFHEGYVSGTKNYVCILCHPNFQEKGTLSDLPDKRIKGYLSAKHNKNFADHLFRAHQITDKCHPSIVSVKSNIARKAAAHDSAMYVHNGLVFHNNELTLLMMSESYLPFSSVHKPIFKKAVHVGRGIQSRNNISQQMEVLTHKIFSHKLKGLVGSAVGVAIDGGSQWGNKYNATVIHVVGKKQSFLWDLIPISSPPFNGRSTSDAYAAYVDDVVANLRKHGLIVTNVVTVTVTDNASNMLGIRKLSKSQIFFAPCVAHSIQLFAEDIIQAEDFVQLIKDCKELRAEFPRLRLPEAAETRWNGAVRLAQAIIKKWTDISNLESLPDKYNATFLRKLKAFVEFMLPLWDFTDYAQASDRTSIEILSAFETVYRMNDRNTTHKMTDERFQDVFDDRMKRFVSEPLVLLAYFCPILDRKKFHSDDFDMINSIVRLIIQHPKSSLLINSVFPKQFNSKGTSSFSEAALISEFDQFVEIPPPMQKNFTSAAYLKWIKEDLSIRSPCLSKLLLFAAYSVPTEAGAERAFSIMNKLVALNRSNLSQENVAMQLKLNLAVRDTTNCFEWNEDETQDDCQESDDFRERADRDAEICDLANAFEERFSQIVITDMWLQYFLQSSRIIFEENKKAEQDKPCACGRMWKSHLEGGRNRVDCNSCRRRFGIECAPNPVHNPNIWVCANCVWDKSRRPLFS